jgi:hypothetical protein
MKNLIIPPKDPSTSFLSQIYAPLKNKTVITGGITQTELRKLIKSHDRILMMGHGNGSGLMSVGQFPGEYSIIDYSMVGELCEKENSIYIWCDADFFLWLHNLNGLCCGMFLSELEECRRFGFKDVNLNLITESNNVFASIMSRHINEPNDELYRNLVYEYGLLAQRNPIAKFNHERLYLFPKSTEEQESMIFCDDVYINEIGEKGFR